MEILVDNSGYPTEAIARNSHDYRPLGLGYANLGALLMSMGLPYDSEAGRDLAGSMTAMMTGQAYLQSAIIAAQCPPLTSATPLTASVEHQGGACPGYYVNREPFLDVIRMHRAEVNNIGKSQQSNEPFTVPQLDALIDASRECWDMALLYGERYGYRNSQTTVLAPTGTIGFMMDCDTTGIEPDLALVKYKKLVGGGMIKIVNNTVPSALFKLGYDNEEVNAIVSYIEPRAPSRARRASGRTPGGVRLQLSGQGHALHSLHGAHQDDGRGPAVPVGRDFEDGESAARGNVEDVAEAYAESWRQGIKAVSIYRDGSKGTQPLNVSMDVKKEPSALDAVGSRMLTSLAASQAAAEADVKLLEAHWADKVEISAKQLLATVQAFQKALDEIAAAASVPVLTPAPAMNLPPRFPGKCRI